MNRDETVVRLDERTKAILEGVNRIEIQVEKTNGRVRSLEKWRNTVVGGMGVLILLGGWYVAWHG